MATYAFDAPQLAPLLLVVGTFSAVAKLLCVSVASVEVVVKLLVVLCDVPNPLACLWPLCISGLAQGSLSRPNEGFRKLLFGGSAEGCAPACASGCGGGGGGGSAAAGADIVLACMLDRAGNGSFLLRSSTASRLSSSPSCARPIKASKTLNWFRASGEYSSLAETMLQILAWSAELIWLSRNSCQHCSVAT